MLHYDNMYIWLIVLGSSSGEMLARSCADGRVKRRPGVEKRCKKRPSRAEAREAEREGEKFCIKNDEFVFQNDIFCI